ncbi:MAG: ATP-binding cassette domain-containing protein [Eubacteriales bacterium]|nr:ATP-binding cassette domain-containing protein [Eubacteriales bacterium]
MSEDIVLRTDHITKTYGNQKALSGVSITIKRGEIYGLVGNNGAGKTTFMRLISSQSLPTEGSLLLFGAEEEKEIRKARRRIGTLIETPGFFSYMSARENLEYFRRQFGIPGKECIDEVLEEVGLADCGKKRYKNFSLGMKQRLGVALAIMHSPEFLILDEPINGLDPEGILEMRTLLQDLNKKKNMTILISSHILSELSSVATRYGFLKNGILKEEISAQELLRKCSVYLEVKVSDSKKAAALLETRLGITEYQVYPDDSLHIFEKMEQTREISRLLVQEGIDLELLVKRTMDLEGYYMNLMEGQQS